MKKLLLYLVSVVFFVAACSTGNEFATYDRQLNKQQSQVDSLKTVTNNIQTEIDNLQNSTVDKLQNIKGRLVVLDNIDQKIDSMESRLLIMENRLEMQQNSIKELFDTTTAGENAAQSQTPQTSEEIYNYALQLHMNGEYQKSIEDLTQLIHSYPDCELSANSYYWMGENYFSLEQYETAMYNFDKVIQNYPNSNKVVDAKLKIAMCLIGMKEYSGALTQLNKIKSNHPNYPKLNLVEEKIEWLNQQ